MTEKRFLLEYVPPRQTPRAARKKTRPTPAAIEAGLRAIAEYKRKARKGIRS